MVKKAKILIQKDLRESLTFSNGKRNLSYKSLWIKRLALMAVLNCCFRIKGWVYGKSYIST